MGADGVPPPLSVVGPLARSAADLSLALDVLAGPSSEQALGYRLALPPARHAGLADFRILVLTTHPSAQVDSEVRSAIEAIAGRLEGLGARVSRESALLPDLAKAHGAYMDLLNTAMAMRGPEPPKTTAAEWIAMLDRQVEVRRQWANLFEDNDVVLTPAFGTAAYPHDSRDPGERTLTLDGAQTPYFAQLAWPGLASLGNLPATAVPISQTRAGLPIGMQVIGPYLEDRTTIGFARLLEREFGGFRRPPGL
jgi:amidase